VLQWFSMRKDKSGVFCCLAASIKLVVPAESVCWMSAPADMSEKAHFVLAGRDKHINKASVNSDFANCWESSSDLRRLESHDLATCFI